MKELKITCKRKAAFTLAEVLITLGIIGVVAAMTMPALIQNHKKAEAIARLKKFYSVMAQAIILSEIDNGPSTDWEKYANGSGNNYWHSEEFFNKYLKNYLKILKTDKDNSTNLFRVVFNDGSTVTMNNGNCIDFIFDYNGDTRPNEEGRDKYVFLLCSDEYKRVNNNFSTYIRQSNLTRTQTLNLCKNDPIYCSALLEVDNWVFRNDYPYRL